MQGTWRELNYMVSLAIQESSKSHSEKTLHFIYCWRLKGVICNVVREAEIHPKAEPQLENMINYLLSNLTQECQESATPLADDVAELQGEPHHFSIQQSVYHIYL